MEDTTLRTIVWEEMLFADMCANYFAELMRHYLRLDKILRVATLLGSSGVFAIALLKWENETRVLAPIFATLVSFWLLFSQYSTLARATPRTCNPAGA